MRPAVTSGQMSLAPTRVPRGSMWAPALVMSSPGAVMASRSRPSKPARGGKRFTRESPRITLDAQKQRRKALTGYRRFSSSAATAANPVGFTPYLGLDRDDWSGRGVAAVPDSHVDSQVFSVSCRHCQSNWWRPAVRRRTSAPP
jgi:hypothetical protein